MLSASVMNVTAFGMLPHHVLIDKFCVKSDPSNWSPAVKFLRGTSSDAGKLSKVQEAIASLDITGDRWRHETLSSVHIPSLGCSTTLGIRLAYVGSFGRCRITDVIADLPANIHVGASDLLNCTATDEPQ